MRTTTARQINHTLEQVMRSLCTFVFDDGFESVEPLLRFHHVRIVSGLRQYVVELC
jgi:hypothetical protein